MVTAKRYNENPILSPNKDIFWESDAVFNGSSILTNNKFIMVYRAQGQKQAYANIILSLSTIGIAESFDGFHFGNMKQLIKPDQDYERFGCEDPRITEFEGKKYIFYTALSQYPFNADGIKVAGAIINDKNEIIEKHLVTTFNAKAFALFPDRVDGKITAILTANTDRPPSKISIAYFNKIEEIWSTYYWENFYKNLDSHTIKLTRSNNDHVEVGAPPIKTNEGWLLIYCYIYNYFSPKPLFAIEAVLLDNDDPKTVIARTRQPLLIPEEAYELYGIVPNIVFPSGAVVQNENLIFFYGAADTTICRASVNLYELLGDLVPESGGVQLFDTKTIIPIERSVTNPVIAPKKENKWENQFTFNPAAIYTGNKLHILYRAMGDDNTSVLGYASSNNGINFNQRSKEPVYIPREDFEIKKRNGNSGCEDPRLTQIDNKIFMLYTAFDAVNPPRVALTSISVSNFQNNKWDWEKPILISPPNIDDKDAVLFPEKINGKFVLLHRFNPDIWIDYVDDLDFANNRYLGGQVLMKPRIYSWDSDKIGAGPPPIKTEFGWLFIYHGISRYSLKYRLGAALLDLKNPSKLLSRLNYPILEPESEHEKRGYRPDTVFSCGAVVLDKKLLLYNGAGDQVVNIVSMSLPRLIEELRKNIKR